MLGFSLPSCTAYQSLSSQRLTSLSLPALFPSHSAANTWHLSTFLYCFPITQQPILGISLLSCTASQSLSSQCLAYLSLPALLPSHSAANAWLLSTFLHCFPATQHPMLGFSHPCCTASQSLSSQPMASLYLPVLLPSHSAANTWHISPFLHCLPVTQQPMLGISLLSCTATQSLSSQRLTSLSLPALLTSH